MKSMAAKELLDRLLDGERAFSRIKVHGDFVWDSVSRGDLTVARNLHLCEMHFTGECHIGDLTVDGDLHLGGTIFDQRCTVYRVNARMFTVMGSAFTRGLGIVNSRFDIIDLMSARFSGDVLSPPCGLLIKRTSGQLLRLDRVRSPSTVLIESDFGKTSETDAELGRRTPTTLGEIMAA